MNMLRLTSDVDKLMQHFKRTNYLSYYQRNFNLQENPSLIQKTPLTIEQPTFQYIIYIITVQLQLKDLIQFMYFHLIKKKNRTRRSSSLELCYTLLRFVEQVDIAVVISMINYEVMQFQVSIFDFLNRSRCCTSLALCYTL